MNVKKYMSEGYLIFYCLIGIITSIMLISPKDRMHILDVAALSYSVVCGAIILPECQGVIVYSNCRDFYGDRLDCFDYVNIRMDEIREIQKNFNKPTNQMDIKEREISNSKFTK